MAFNKSNRGQAAIEFLMTYGWMLLVVLIVGALIFSFVDFGSLLPNKVDLNNQLRGSAAESLAYSNDAANGDNVNEMRIVFSYIGAKQALINYDGGEIIDSLGNSCYSYKVENLDTNGIAGCDTDQAGACDDAAVTALTRPTGVPFLNGQQGMISLICGGTGPTPATIGNAANAPTVGNLLLNDVLEGELTIGVVTPKTGLSVPSKGPIRIVISQ
ncbi:MAG: hypothetical protein H6500_05970 [Candidatus Woesearchaeota archaeon]|nr:MAG: hypothetical protein H6500_05970 [Candidatus Woesearchaeota archaeon]